MIFVKLEDLKIKEKGKSQSNKKQEENFNRVETDKYAKSDKNNDFSNLKQNEILLLSRNAIFNEIIKCNNFKSNDFTQKNLNSKEEYKSFKCSKVKEFLNPELLEKHNPLLFMLKRLLDKVALNKQMKNALLDFCCELYESLKLFSFNKF